MFNVDLWENFSTFIKQKHLVLLKNFNKIFSKIDVNILEDENIGYFLWIYYLA